MAKTQFTLDLQQGFAFRFNQGKTIEGVSAGEAPWLIYILLYYVCTKSQKVQLN